MPLGTPVASTPVYAGPEKTLDVNYPVGTQDGDVLVLVVGIKSQSRTASVDALSGWTARGSTVNKGGYGGAPGGDTGDTDLYFLTKDSVTSSDVPPTTVSVSVSNQNNWWATIIRVPKGDANPVTFGYFDGEDTTDGATFTSGAMTRRDGGSDANFMEDDVVIWAGGIPTDAGGTVNFSSPSITGTGATFSATELNEIASASGQDIGGVFGYGTCTVPPTSGTPTLSMTSVITTNVRGPLVIFRVRYTAADGLFFWAFP